MQEKNKNGNKAVFNKFEWLMRTEAEKSDEVNGNIIIYMHIIMHIRWELHM